MTQQLMLFSQKRLRSVNRRRRVKTAIQTDPVFAEAMRAALDIREWTDGPKPASWRVYRLAQALRDV